MIAMELWVLIQTQFWSVMVTVFLHSLKVPECYISMCQRIVSGYFKKDNIVTALPGLSIAHPWLVWLRRLLTMLLYTCYKEGLGRGFLASVLRDDLTVGLLLYLNPALARDITALTTVGGLTTGLVLAITTQDWTVISGPLTRALLPDQVTFRIILRIS